MKEQKDVEKKIDMRKDRIILHDEIECGHSYVKRDKIVKGEKGVKKSARVCKVLNGLSAHASGISCHLVLHHAVSSSVQLKQLAPDTFLLLLLVLRNCL